MSITFIHAADLHLDSPFKGLTYLPEQMKEQVRNSTFTAFSNLIQYALVEQPDFLLIVGDIYDGEDRSLRAQMKFQEGMEALEKANIPVYLCYGNHDHLQGNWPRFQLPSNVYEFPSTVTTKTIEVRNQLVHLHGFSYAKRHITEPMIEHYPHSSEKQGIHIGLLHGSPDGDTSHAHYAPFRKSQLLAKHYNYWALGHIHKRQQLHGDPLIVYPGNTQGLHRSDQGQKGFYSVCLQESKTKLTFVPTDAVQFNTIQIDVEGITHANELFNETITRLSDYVGNNGPAIVEVEWFTNNIELQRTIEQSPLSEWVMMLRESLEAQSLAIAVHSVSLHVQSVEEQKQSFTQKVENTMHHWDVHEWNEVFMDLYNHRDIITYFNPFTRAEIADIKEEAEKIIQIEMSKMK